MSAHHRLASRIATLSKATLRGSLTLAAGLLVALLLPAGASATPELSPFEILSSSFKLTSSPYEAGAHADVTTAFDFNHNEAGETFGDVRTTVVNLPAGFMGNDTAIPTCTAAQLIGANGGFEPECPPDTQIGTISLDLGLFTPLVQPEPFTFPVYNMQPTSGITAALGFKALLVTQILDVSVRPSDPGLTVTSPSIEDLGEIHNISVTIWGVPADASHNAQRGQECYALFGEVECHKGGEEVSIPVAPFLANPTNCSAQALEASMTSDSWEEPEHWSQAMTDVAPMTECERVPFNPSLKVEPTTNSAESPTGLNLSLEVPQTWEDPNTLATAPVKDTKVTLPEGYTLNPSAGNGLKGCTPAQYEAETAFSPPGAGCPSQSRLGKVLIETPVLTEEIKGNIYLAQPYDNPFYSLVSMYIVAKAPERGIIIKAAGKVEANPVTGQLVAVFDNTPQQPFSRLTLELKQGQTSPLVSPPTCGSYTVDAALTPWSAPEEPRLLSNSFQIEHGIGGGTCPPGGVPPFKPEVTSGTQSNAAATYSPFYLRISREDGEQEITKFSTVLPPGLTGNLTGVPFCPDSDIEAARLATGRAELEAPSCPGTSEIGHSLVGAGVGGVLAWTPGKVYLAGPYHGAPMSVVSITSATVGPFDLGTVVIRFALDINPITAQVEISGASSDPIPHIIDGIVVHVRDIHVYIDRHDFIINPTSCEPMSIANTITGTGADPANPSDQMPVSTTRRFQAGDCARLGFKPSLTFSTSAKTSRTEGASLTAKLTYPSAPLGTQTNIARVHVELPKQLPSRLTTLQKACPDTTFDADPSNCPAASRVGYATASTPLIPAQLAGPAYFVSHGGAKFPELIVVLSGYGLTIQLHGETFISKAGVTSTTFNTVPDQPIGSFELKLPAGPDSALAANGNLCAEKLSMPTTITAQNGRTIEEHTPISVEGCRPQIRVIRHKVSGKTATVVVSVPSAGRLIAAGGGVVRASRRVGKAGVVTMRLRLTRSEQRFVARHHNRRLRVPIKLSFKPARGGNLKATVAVLMR